MKIIVKVKMKIISVFVIMVIVAMKNYYYYQQLPLSQTQRTSSEFYNDICEVEYSTVSVYCCCCGYDSTTYPKCE